MPNNERERRISMLRAALPYTSGRQRRALDLFLQADNLINTFRGNNETELEAYEAPAQPEEMLLHMQEYCTPRESDFIQMTLNFIKANHLFQNYRSFISARQPQLQGAETGSAEHPFTGSINPLQMLVQMISGLGGLAGPAGTDSGQIMDFLMTQLSPEQKQLFEQLRSTANDENRKDMESDELQPE